MMQYYSAKVRLGGLTTSEVQKVLSAPEVLILQFIHGIDGVVDVKPCKKGEISLRDEKDRLKGIYDQGLVKRDQSVDTIFGPLGSVPSVLPDDLLERYNIVDEDDVLAVAKNVTKLSKTADKGGRIPQNLTEQDRVDTVISNDEVSLSDLAE